MVPVGSTPLHHFDHTPRASIAPSTMLDFGLHHIPGHRATGIFSGDVQVPFREWGGGTNETESTRVTLEPTFNLIWHCRQRQTAPKHHQRFLFNHQIKTLLEQVQLFIWH